MIAKISDLYNKLNKYKWLVVFVLMFPFMKMSYFRTVMILTPIYDVFRWLFTLILIYIYFFVKKKKPNKIMIFVFIMEIWVLVNVLIKLPNNFIDALKDALSILSVELIIEIFKDDSKTLINGLMFNYEIAIYLELISLILYPSGFHNDAVHFLGYYNIFIIYVIPALGVATLYYKKENKIIRPLLLTLASIACIILAKAATPLVALIGIIGVIIFEIAMGKLIVKHRTSLIPWATIALLGSLFVVFVYSGIHIDFIDNFIRNFLHRDITFSGRTFIWEEGFNLIKQKPITGYGFGTNIIVKGNTFRGHNEIIHRTLNSGIIGLISFIAFNIVYIAKTEKYKNDIFKIIFVALSFGMFLTFITEAYTNIYLYYVLIFLYYNFDCIE